MRQKLISLLLAAAMALPMTGCVQIAIVGGEDGPTEILIGGPAAPDQSAPGLPGEDEPSGAPEESPQPAGYTGQEDGPLYTTEPEGDDLPEEDGTYNSAEDVALYLDCYGHLPDNYITKSEARDLGWTGGSVEQVAPGCAIGGDQVGASFFPASANVHASSRSGTPKLLKCVIHISPLQYFFTMYSSIGKSHCASKSASGSSDITRSENCRISFSSL